MMGAWSITPASEDPHSSGDAALLPVALVVDREFIRAFMDLLKI
jgi:hypothetical protein